MFETLNLTLNQLGNMFLFMIIGFIMRKKKIGGDDVSKVLSSLLVNLFLPAMFFLNFLENFNLKNLSENMYLLLFGILVLAISFVPAKIFSKLLAKNNLQKDVYMYSLLIPNLGYMGYPLMEAVFGEQMLFFMMMFAIPYQFTIYTYGMYILNPNRSFTAKKLLNPIIIALILGMIFGIAEIKLPTFLMKALTSAESCMSPSAMILTGFVLGATPIKPIFKDIRLFVTAFLRGIIIPIAFFAVMMLLKVDTIFVTVAIVTLAMPLGLNSVVFPEAYGGDSLTGAKATFMSNILSIITIPIMFGILGLYV